MIQEFIIIGYKFLEEIQHYGHFQFLVTQENL